MYPYRVRSWEEFFEAPLPVVLDTMDEAAARYPLTTIHPSSHRVPVRNGPLPQVFRRYDISCPACGQETRVRELAVAVRASCPRCGHDVVSLEGLPWFQR